MRDPCARMGGRKGGSRGSRALLEGTSEARPASRARASSQPRYVRGKAKAEGRGLPREDSRGGISQRAEGMLVPRRTRSSSFGLPFLDLLSQDQLQTLDFGGRELRFLDDME